MTQQPYYMREELKPEESCFIQKNLTNWAGRFILLIDKLLPQRRFFKPEIYHKTKRLGIILAIRYC